MIPTLLKIIFKEHNETNTRTFLDMMSYAINGNWLKIHRGDSWSSFLKSDIIESEFWTPDSEDGTFPGYEAFQDLLDFLGIKWRDE